MAVRTVDEPREARLDASERRLLGKRVRDRRLTGAFERGRKDCVAGCEDGFGLGVAVGLPGPRHCTDRFDRPNQKPVTGVVELSPSSAAAPIETNRGASARCGDEPPERPGQNARSRSAHPRSRRRSVGPASRRTRPTRSVDGPQARVPVHLTQVEV